MVHSSSKTFLSALIQIHVLVILMFQTYHSFFSFLCLCSLGVIVSALFLKANIFSTTVQDELQFNYLNISHFKIWFRLTNISYRNDICHFPILLTCTYLHVPPNMWLFILRVNVVMFVLQWFLWLFSYWFTKGMVAAHRYPFTGIILYDTWIRIEFI